MKPRWTKGQGRPVQAPIGDRRKQQMRGELECRVQLEFDSSGTGGEKVWDIPIQVAESGDLVFFFGLTMVVALPRFAASVFANRSLALRCCGVWAYRM